MKSKIIKLTFAIWAILGLLQPNNILAQGQTEVQLKSKHEEFLKWEFGLFMHFNMGTFTNRDWATGNEDPLAFNPVKLNCNQWAKAAKKAGMKYAVLTVKHTGGWCLWNSKYTTHDVGSFKNYKDGKGDILEEYVKAMRKHGIKVGIYYCFPGNYSVKYGNKIDDANGYKITEADEDIHGLPPEAKGDYPGFIKKQITELLSNYGPIDLIWIDQWSNKYTHKNWPEIKSLIHKLQPNCIVIANNAHDYKVTDILSYEFPIYKIGFNELVPVGNKNASEVCDLVDKRKKWFWNNESECILHEAEDIVKNLNVCSNRNANYLLNIPPDTEGLISGKFLKLMKEIGKLNKNKSK